MKTFKIRRVEITRNATKSKYYPLKKKSEKHNYMYLRITLLEMKITKLLNLKMKKIFLFIFPIDVEKSPAETLGTMKLYRYIIGKNNNNNINNKQGSWHTYEILYLDIV